MRLHLVVGSVLALAACANEVAPTTPAATTRNTAPLLDTRWDLVQLGDRVIDTPVGAREIHFVLHAENQRMDGFSGCNRMMGSYVLDGAAIKIEQIAGTMMACAPDMDLERKFLAMFPQVARWEISGETLRLQDSQGAPLAIFAARAPQ